MYRPGSQETSGFLTEKNMTTLYTALIQDFEERHGALNDIQTDRLSKTLHHYITQVQQRQGDKPIPVLNREVLGACAKDFSQYLQRKESTKAKNPVKQVMDPVLFQDTSTQFERLTTERREVKSLPPAIPDFRISLKEDGPPAAEMYEMAKKQREMEMLRAAQSSELKKAEMGLQGRITADSLFRNAQDQQNRDTELVLVQRNQPSSSPVDMPLALLPDRRELMMSSNFPNSNVTITKPVLERHNLPQDLLIPENNVVSYREIESNLFLYSADRDWLRNNKENRYSFTVNFDPAANGQSFGPTLAAQQKFKNIVRIELVKVTLPGESLHVTVSRRRDVAIPDTTYQDNVLNSPFITLRVAELDNNNFGTDQFIDRSFGVLHYDSQWVSDQTTQTRGFLGFLPKHLACQKVFYPTPLSTLQKLTIDLRLPNGELISISPDTFDVGGILAPQLNEIIGTMFPFLNAIKYTDTSLRYNMMIPQNSGNPANFYINTAKFFSKFEMSTGDRIVIQGYTYADAVLNDPQHGQDLRGFCMWVNRPEGHIILDVAHHIGFNPVNDVSNLADGYNEVGYANFIVIQARYQDPTSGSVALQPFGNDLGAVLNAYGASLQSPIRLMNLNKQTTVVFRVITREMDSLPQIRPNNNY